MSVTMTDELRRKMRNRPVLERFRLRRLLRRLGRLDRCLRGSFVGEAGFAMSDHMTGGRLTRLEVKIRNTEQAIASITQPVLTGVAA